MEQGPGTTSSASIDAEACKLLINLDQDAANNRYFKLLERDEEDKICEEESPCPCRFCKAIELIQDEAKDYWYITNERDEKGQTILHHAAKCGVTRTGFAVSVKVLSLCRKFNIDQEQLYSFVNATDNNGFTVLHYAASSNNKDLVSVLLRNYADINLLNSKTRTNAANLVCDRVHRELLYLFDSHLTIIPDKLDLENELMWTVHCDFGPVIGAYEKFKETKNQTKNLATWLRRSSTKSDDILLHPLMQIFLYEKGRRYIGLRYMSMIYHVLFYVSWVLVAHCYAAVTNRNALEEKLEFLSLSTPSTDGVSDQVSNEYLHVSNVLNRIRKQKRQAFCSEKVDMLIQPTICLLVINITKEILEYWMSDERLFFWKQWQNIFQCLLYIPFIGLLFNQNEEIRTLYYIVSIFIAMALVQDQLSKTEILGFYSEIFASGFKNVLRIGFAFMPFFTAFTVTFSLLLPMNPEFQLFGYSKIAAMVTGELNYDAVFFSDGSESKDVMYPWLTKLWFLIFVVAITMLFSNLVIACTITDVQKLESEARANYLSTRFDDIYLIEHVIMHPVCLRILGLFGCDHVIVEKLNVCRLNSSTNSTGKRLDEYPEDLRSVIKQWHDHSNRQNKAQTAEN